MYTGLTVYENKKSKVATVYDRLQFFTWWKLVVVPDVESVSEKPPMEEDVSQDEDGEDDHQVQELAQDEAPEVNAKSTVNIFREILQKYKWIDISSI